MLLSTGAVLLQLLAPSASPARQDTRLLRDAQTAQTRFEATRRTNLPRDWSGGSSGRCDARIGRYCYWYDSTESPPKPEPKAIADARIRLLRILDSAARRNPADAWLAGQRTRYLIEAGRGDSAIAAARDCESDRWWCAALEGLALHVGRRYAEADSVYGVSLRSMPDAQRCEWLDLRLVVGESLERDLARAGCAERAEIADRLWTLSQPLWSTRGNDLRTEHFARLTMAAILPRSANPYSMAWGQDSRELLVRYGWAEWFTRQESGSSIYTSPSITGHDREPSYSFFPDVQSVRNVSHLSATHWNLRQPTARSRYAPRHLKGLSVLTHQLARFPRGDSMLVAVAYSVRDTALEHDSASAYAGVLQRERRRVIGPAVRRGVVSFTIANDTLIASIEVVGEKSKRAARARYTVEPLSRGSTALSDLLLFAPARADSAMDLETLTATAFTDGKVSVREPLGVYWELQAAYTEAPVWLSLTVEPVRTSFARRIATRLRLAPEYTPVRLRWQGGVQRRLAGQRVTLRLPLRARGTYRVVLSIETPGAPLTSSREIDLVP